MSKEKPLYIPPDKRNFGIKTDCAICSLVFDKCKETGKPLQQCPHGEKHSYKVIAYLNSKQRRTKNLKTRDLKQALIEAVLFQKEIKDGINDEQNYVAPVSKSKEQPGALSLIDALALHAGYINGESKYEHKKSRVRSPQHRAETAKVYKDFILCLKNKGYSVRQLSVTDIDDEHISAYHSELKASNRSPRTYDKKIGILKTAFNFFMKENYVRRNPFAGIPTQGKPKEVPIITKEEFKLLEEILQKPEAGIWKAGDEEKNLHRPSIMLPAIRLGAYTGRRLSEILHTKWDQVKTNAKGEMQFLDVIDEKVSRQQGRLESDPKRVKVPVIPELKKLLTELQNKKETEKDPENYILNGEGMTRESLRNFVSRSFSHHWKQLKINKPGVSFKTLRATYISHLADYMGIDNSIFITGHSGTQILKSNYLSQELLSQSAKEFKVFENAEAPREVELRKERKLKGQKSRNKGIQITK